jgi:hypothetical protein
VLQKLAVVANRKTTAQASKEAGIAEQTYFRWCNPFQNGAARAPSATGSSTDRLRTTVGRTTSALVSSHGRSRSFPAAKMKLCPPGDDSFKTINAVHA